MIRVDQSGYEKTDTFDDGISKPLPQAARKLRIAAVDRIPALVLKLKKAAADALAAIEKAKEIADSVE